jgi:hypothetical protein
MKSPPCVKQGDYLKAIRPFRNGCSFRARFEADGRVMLEPGCYCLGNLLQGVDRWFLEQWKANGEKPFEIYPAPETQHGMLKMRECRWCRGTLIAKKSQ